MRDRLNTVIYVGKARDLRKRLSQYFTPSRKRMSDLKTRALINSIWNFDVHVVRNESESLLLEVRLIKEYRPRYNVSFRDDKRFLLLKVRLDVPWPRFELCRLKSDDGARYFGPFAHGGALRATLDWMTRVFGLRSCRVRSPGEADYRHCHDDIIRNCTAPCIGKIGSEEYLERIEEACAFLDGRRKERLGQLESEMEAAAERLDFEKAAELRDVLDNLRKTLKPVRRFAHRRRFPSDTDNALADVEELGKRLRLEHPPLVMECFDISNISTTYSVASMVRFTNGKPDSANYRRYRIKTVAGQDDFASMAEVVRRRYARILLESGDTTADPRNRDRINEAQSIEEPLASETLTDGGEPNHTSSTRFVTLPDLVIVDGGKGQLSSAFAELRRLGLGDLPVIGLAKENEEIYRPGRIDPLLIPHDRGALKLLQRIRDEAHRFANGYHQLLMKRRISESALDDCPGISEKRKTALLRKFGSVARLRKASAEEIASLPGFSKKTAETVLDHLG